MTLYGMMCSGDVVSSFAHVLSLDVAATSAVTVDKNSQRESLLTGQSVSDTDSTGVGTDSVSSADRVCPLTLHCFTSTHMLETTIFTIHKLNHHTCKRQGPGRFRLG